MSTTAAGLQLLQFHVFQYNLISAVSWTSERRFPNCWNTGFPEAEKSPMYYRTFPGNFPDARSLDVILLDLAHASFHNIILVTDRGYDSLQNLEKYILKKQPMIMCVKVGKSLVLEKIKQFGSFFHIPEGMSIDTKTMLYYMQYDVDYTVVGANFHGTATVPISGLNPLMSILLG